MHIYRFRLLNDEDDDFLRDIEIGSNQTFSDFHDVIRKAAGINSNELASFFVCDKKWQKQLEITLVDMGEGFIEMNRSILKDFVTEPKQRLLYEYNILSQGALFIELIASFKSKSDKKYPAITKSVGYLFDQKKMNEDNFTPPEVDQNELLKEFEAILKGEMEVDDFEPDFDD
ncbi:MAG: hypothetical protein KAG99_11540 [Bacteroidales bacterium]|nr:hypothetical protein [Bacteroidales bacterium]